MQQMHNLNSFLDAPINFALLLLKRRNCQLPDKVHHFMFHLFRMPVILRLINICDCCLHVPYEAWSVADNDTSC